ncbi:hypothetical protein COU75_01945 [Candidatus Peregrinibacteria bacterium CG10_big_fil_rev_8_21_14_0_10_42_8]|nr:MAG: hypothetical protein COU75_01945 [Candidatus Peregrinibacteria bacterium CG10_big_fil_rev_8_21_14_0_10_42_8]
MAQRRHRRRHDDLRAKERNARVRRLAILGLLAIGLIIVSNKTLEFFGVGNAIRRTATILNIEDRGVINVSVDNGPLKRAENELSLYAGDTIVSSPQNNATLTFFDNSSMRLDESTQISIKESFQGEASSIISVELEAGTLWVSTPKLATYSGSITRSISSPYLNVELPTRTELVITPRSLAVFSADGLGVSVIVAGNDQKIIIGEGQQFTLPVGGEGIADLYAYRKPLDPSQLQSEFVEKSRSVYAGSLTPDNIVVTGGEDTKPKNNIALTIESPEDGTVIQSSAVKVSGRIGEDVEKVRINGYLANINKEKSTFEQEIVLPDEDEVSIAIEAVDSAANVIGEAIRTVIRDRKPPEPPVISSPAGNGDTYLTGSQEIEISGTAPKGAIGIEINNYRLQLFEPGDTKWSYLANTKYNNYTLGENVYEVVAINRGGYRSDPAKIVIILGEGQEGIVASGTTVNSVAKPTQSAEEAALPSNTPLMPGTISIFSPQAGTEYEASEAEFLIEGNIPKEVASVWVNGYNLRLYEKGKGFFNYIASVELNTLKRGRNVYHIATRDEAGRLLDEIDYVVTFAPGR